jgi:hypothetical protein
MVTLVIDGKQMSQAGAFSLSANAAGGNTQNSMAWIEAVLRNLEKSSPAYKAVEAAAKNNTLAAIGVGSLTVRDSAAQQQDTATLRRDATGTANGLSPIFNKQAELHRLQAIQLIGDIGQQTLQIANSHKRAELNAATERAKADPLYANSADY